MKCARAYGSACLQVILVYLIHFVAIHSSAAENRKKSRKTIFWGFKVIDVDIPKKFFARARYDKQHVCAYLSMQPFSC